MFLPLKLKNKDVNVHYCHRCCLLYSKNCPNSPHQKCWQVVFFIPINKTSVLVADLSHENFKSSRVMRWWLSRLSSRFGAKSSRESKPKWVSDLVWLSKLQVVFKLFNGSRCHLALNNCIANSDLYATIRVGQDPNIIGHNSWGSFVPMHHAFWRHSVFNRRSWPLYPCGCNNTKSNGQVYLNFNPVWKLINTRFWVSKKHEVRTSAPSLIIILIVHLSGWQRKYHRYILDRPNNRTTD